MSTESIDPRYAALDEWPASDAVCAMWEGQLAAIAAVGPACTAIADASVAAAARLQEGGRLVYVGAGTSGRLGLLDGVELGPTFGWSADRLVTLIAGGMGALTEAVEGAEDDEEAARVAVADAGVGAGEVVIGIAASGLTPFTCAAVEAARLRGALTVAIANSAGTRLLAAADHAILVETGAEVIAGSTRMKAGTAQKAALNMFSSATMVTLGRVHGGRMVAMRSANSKLRARAKEMVAAIAGITPDAAQAALEATGHDIRIAVLVGLGASPSDAASLLSRRGGRLRAAMADLRV